VGAIPLRWSPNALVLTGTTNAKGTFDLAGAFPERYVLGAIVVRAEQLTSCRRSRPCRPCDI
jgi:hypothetical protein